MLTLVLAATLAQSPQVQCLSSNGETRCTRTPWGRCVATNGQVFCGDPSPATLRLLEEPPPVQCVTINGTAACGYGCETINGQAACAATPWGRCVATNGKLFCADPPAWVLRAGEPPQAECVTINGTAACGYGCKTINGQAACARTPWGRCVTTNGKLFCADPAQWVLRGHEPPPQMDCVTTNGTGACGYDCKTTNGKAACAAAPWGRCVAFNGEITCSP